MEFDLRFNHDLFDQLDRNQYLTDSDIFDTYKKCFDELLNYLNNVLLIDRRDHVGIKFRLVDTNDSQPFGIRFMELRLLSSVIITDLLMKVQQSNSAFKNNEKIEVNVIAIDRTQKMGNRIPLWKINLAKYEQLCDKKKRSILIPFNELEYNDDKCLPRALIIGQYWAMYKQNRKKMRTLLVKSNSTLLKRKTDALIKKAFGADAVNVARDKFTLSDLLKFNKVLKTYQITVYDDINLHKKVVYRSNRKCEKKINLFYLSQHEHVIAIANVKGFFGTPIYCNLCDMPQKSKKHYCISRCSSCFSSPVCLNTIKEKNSDFRVYCDKCNRYFKSKKCYTNHFKIQEESGYSVCGRYKICKKCFTFIDNAQLTSLSRDKKNPVRHVCQEKYCWYCYRFVSEEAHYCNIRAYSLESPSKYMFFFFDMETVQTKEIKKTQKKRVLKTIDEQKQVLDKLIESGKEENDYESRRSYYKTEVEVQTEFMHEPILLICHAVCWKCCDVPFGSAECEICGEARYVFEGRNCVIDFLNLVMDYKADVSQIVCIAHNLRAFDGQLLMRDLLNIPNHDIKLIQNGFKILKIELKGYISFIDSLNFIPGSLSKFKDMFGLEDDYEKGFFPYMFLSYSNWNYVGKLPPSDQFGFNLNDTKCKRVQAFLKWYNEQPKDNYSLREQCISYCDSDVKVLRAGCLSYNKLIMKISGINAFTCTLTLAQLSMTIFRKKFMKEGMLGIIPENNYRLNGNQSKMCRSWLTYLNYFKSKETNVNYYVEPEVRLRGEHKFIVDGFCKNWPFINNDKQSIFEALGCFYHGCVRCNSINPYKLNEKQVQSDENNEQAPVANRYDPNAHGLLDSRLDKELYSRGYLFRQRYQKTMAKINYLKSLGTYNVIVMWEHEWTDFLNKNKKLKTEIFNHPSMLNKCLEPRKALVGGRCEVGSMYYRPRPSERLYFIDVNSLYPAKMATKSMYVGAPYKILRDKECANITEIDLLNMNGLCYLKNVPNNLMRWPVLSCKHDGKVFFVCCRTCLIELKAKTECNHNEEERALTGVWSSTEIKVALRNNYKLLETYELWFYSTECGASEMNISPEDKNITYAELRDRLHVQEREAAALEELISNTKNKRDALEIRQRELRTSPGLFNRFLRGFIKLKAESSGWPFGCETDEQKEQYIVDFFIENNIILKKEDIMNNPTLRLLSKICQNSLYGKMCQMDPNNFRTLISDTSQLQYYLNCDIIEVTDVFIPNNNYCVLSWKYKTDDEGKPIDPCPINPRKSATRHVCLTAAIQITTHGRIHLFEELNKIDCDATKPIRTKYLDTDSLCFSVDENDPGYVPELCNKLGGWTDELEKHRIRADFTPYIAEWVCTGPKSYAMKIINDDRPGAEPIFIVKCKGFQITTELSDKINFESMKSLVLGRNYSNCEDELFYTGKIKTQQKRIRTQKNFAVHTVTETKEFGVTQIKRETLDDYSTIPWGYKGERVLRELVL